MRVGIGVMLLGLMVLAAQAQDAPAEKPMDDDAYVQAQLDARLPQFEKDRLTLTQAMQYLGQMGRINVYVEEAALEAGGFELKTPVFVSAKNITLRECINRTIKSIDSPKTPLRWVVESGVVIVSTEKDVNWRTIPDAATKFAGSEAFKDESVIPEITFDNTRLEECLKNLREAGVNLFVHWQPLKDLAIDRHNKITLTLTKVRPKTAMQLLIRRLAGPKGEVSYILYDNVWIISTPADLDRQKKLWDWRPHNVKDQASADKLAFVLDGVSLNKPFAEAVEDLARMADTTIDINWPSVKDAGVERDTPINFSVKQVKLATAIDLLLTDASSDKLLDYTAKDNTIHVELRKEPEKPATKPTTKPAKPKTAAK